MSRLFLPWTPFRMGGKYWIMGSHGAVVMEAPSKEVAQFVCAAASEHFHLASTVKLLASRLDDEEVGEAEGNHVQFWETLHLRAIDAVERAERKRPVVGEDR